MSTQLQYQTISKRKHIRVGITLKGMRKPQQENNQSS